jgi:hypothetical protein
MSFVFLGDFLCQLAICSEKAACIARHIRFMQGDFNSIIQEKQRNYRRLASFSLLSLHLFVVLVDENHQHLDADYKTLA